MKIFNINNEVEDGYTYIINILKYLFIIYARAVYRNTYIYESVSYYPGLSQKKSYVSFWPIVLDGTANS